MLGLIAGLGSIGRRHLRNLKALRPDCTVVGLRRGDSVDQDFPERSLLERTVTGEELDSVNPDFVIICTPAPFHLSLARHFLGRRVPLLIEKPLSHNCEGVEELCLLAGETPVLVGYNLRFSESLRAFKNAVDGQIVGKPFAFKATVGMYLPHWRPEQPYQNSVSAKAELGGGALLELSHEFDYLSWVFGPVESLFCRAKMLGSLAMNVENWVDILSVTQTGLAGNLHLDMLNARHGRFCEAIGPEGCLTWDAVSHTVEVVYTDGARKEVLFASENVQRDDTYLEELSHFFSALEGREEPLVTLRDGLRTLRDIEAARLSSEEGRWVNPHR